MPKPKIVSTVQEITQGELLTLQDIEPLGIFHATQIKPLPEVNYVLNISETLHYVFGHLNHYPAITVTKPLSAAVNMHIPIIRNCVAVELVLKWALPALYVAEARLRHIDTKSYGYGYIYSYQRRAMMHATIANSYKQLVAELLPLFVVKDREIIKNDILDTLFSGFIKSMCSELADDLPKQITHVRKSHNPSNIDQRMIDKWTELVNLAAALATEANYYRRNHEIFRYNKYLAELKQGTSKHKVPLTDPDDKKKHGMRYIVPPTRALKQLLKDRQLELHPELAVANTVSVKVNPALLTFSHGLQKTKVFASSFMSNEAAQDEEQLRLLDKLEGYQPIYIAPREIKSSSIDDEICLLEKHLIEKFTTISQQDISKLLALAEEGLKLLSLVTMRYGISLNCKNDYSYFGLAKANSAIDKENYSRILISYYADIFYKALKQLSTLIHKNPTIHGNELTQFLEISKTIEGYLQEMPNSSAIQVQTMIQELKNMREPSVLLRDASDTQSPGLRHRTAAHTIT